MDLNYRKKLMVRPGSKVRLADIDPAFTGKHESHETALPEIEQYRQKLGHLQHLLYAERKHAAMNPQGCTVSGFNRPIKWV